MMKPNIDWSVSEIRNFVNKTSVTYEYIIGTKQKLRFYYYSDGNAGRG